MAEHVLSPAMLKRCFALLVVSFVFFACHIPLRKLSEAWYDEAATIACIQRGPVNLAKMLTELDLVHGAYYFIAYTWTVIFPRDLPTLRALSLIVFTLTILVCGLIAYRIASSRKLLSANITMLVLALTPSAQWIAIDARSYVFTLFFFSVSLLLMQIDFERKKVRYTIGVALAMMAAVLFSLMFLLAAPMIAAFHIWHSPKGRRKHVAWAHAGFSIPVAIFAGLCLTQIGQVDWIANVRFDLWDQVSRVQYFVGSYEKLPKSTWDQAATQTAQWLTVALAALALRRRSAWAWLFAALVVVPTIALLVLHIYFTPLYLPRYLSFTTIALALLMSSAICQLRWKLSTLLAVVLCVANLAALQDVLVQHGKFGERYNTFAALRCEADSVYYGDMHARSLTAVEQHCQAVDPMLTHDAATSRSLFGLQRNYGPEEIEYTGKVMIVQVVSRLDWLARAEELSRNRHCVEVQRLTSTRFHALLLDCPT